MGAASRCGGRLTAWGLLLLHSGTIHFCPLWAVVQHCDWTADVSVNDFLSSAYSLLQYCVHTFIFLIFHGGGLIPTNSA